MNILSPLQIGPPNPPNLHANTAKPPAIPKVEASGASNKTDLQHQGQSQAQAAQNTRQSKAKDFADRDTERPTGPPPSFEVNVLEVDRDLQEAIARIEAARGQIRNADGIKPD
ncbi:MAG TPA: hypothetical protein ENK28_02895 [Aliiroseovarius sp.]|nr:hypothetical protein [Aliiroseovarius sp.]